MKHQPSLAFCPSVRRASATLVAHLVTGTFEAVRPTAAMMAAAEPSPALDTLRAEPLAVGTYDRLPMASTAAVYTFDTASEVFMLHSAKV